MCIYVKAVMKKIYERKKERRLNKFSHPAPEIEK